MLLSISNSGPIFMPSVSKLNRISREQFLRVIADKSYISHLPDSAIEEGIDSILENYPFHDMSLNQFKRLISRPESSLREDKSTRYPRYHLNRSHDNVDHWVAESLKLYDRSYYDQMYGYTKNARLGRAFPTLLKFARPVKTSEAINKNPFYRQCYNRALKDVEDLFGNKKFKTLDIPDFMKQIPQNTAAGYPYIGKRKSDVWSEVHRKSVDNYFTLLDGQKIENKPFTIALRGHLSPIDQLKTRPIWLSPFEHIVMENICFRNVYDHVFQDKRLSEIILTGRDTLFRLRDYLNLNTGASFVNLDYSSWDAWRCRFVGMDIFKIFKKIIDFKPGEEKVFYFVRKQFLNSRVMLPDGSCFEKQCGTPSGSLLTALFNSIMNIVILKTCTYILEKDHVIEYLKVLGDDASFYYGLPDVEGFLSKLSGLLRDLFDMKLSPDKCIVTPPGAPTEDKKFIGYSLVGNQLYKPEEDFFLSCLYPEHEVKNVVVSFSRVFSYFMLGGIYHNRFCAWFKDYLRVYWHLLSKEDRILNEEVFKMGNLRVIKHVFQIEVDVFLTAFDVKKFKSIDFMQLPYFLTLKIPLKQVIPD